MKISFLFLHRGKKIRFFGYSALALSPSSIVAQRGGHPRLTCNERAFFSLPQKNLQCHRIKGILFFPPNTMINPRFCVLAKKPKGPANGFLVGHRRKRALSLGRVRDEQDGAAAEERFRRLRHCFGGKGPHVCARTCKSHLPKRRILGKIKRKKKRKRRRQDRGFSLSFMAPLTAVRRKRGPAQWRACARTIR